MRKKQTDQIIEANKIFGKNLAILREAAGISRKELAEKLSLSDNAVWYYERGERSPNVFTLIQLTKILDVSADALIGVEPKLDSKLDFLDDNFKNQILEMVSKDLIKAKVEFSPTERRYNVTMQATPKGIALIREKEKERDIHDLMQAERAKYAELKAQGLNPAGEPLVDPFEEKPSLKNSTGEKT